MEEAAEKILDSVGRLHDGGISIELPEGRYAQGEWKAEISWLQQKEDGGTSAFKGNAPCREREWDGGWRTGVSGSFALGGYDREYAGIRIVVFHTGNEETETIEKDLVWEGTP